MTFMHAYFWDSKHKKEWHLEWNNAIAFMNWSQILESFEWKSKTFQMTLNFLIAKVLPLYFKSTYLWLNFSNIACGSFIWSKNFLEPLRFHRIFAQIRQAKSAWWLYIRYTLKILSLTNRSKRCINMKFRLEMNAVTNEDYQIFCE